MAPGKTNTFDNLTPQQLAALQQKLQKSRLTAVSTDGEHGIQPRPPETGHPCSVGQEQLFWLTRFEPDNKRYILTDVKQLRGNLDLVAFEKSIAGILARHESLRAAFLEADGKQHQIVHPYQATPLFITQETQVQAEYNHSKLSAIVKEEADALVNLDQSPLIRFRLLRLAHDRHILILSIHHIIADRWSLDIIYKELNAHYQAIISGKELALPILPIQYADFAYRQHEWLRGNSAQKQLSFWKQTLSEECKPLRLPTSQQTSLPPTESSHIAQRVIPTAIAERLRKYASATNSTLFVSLFAGFKAALYRYSQQQEMIICTPVAGRKHTETEELVGYFSNIIAIRTDLSGNPDMKHLQERVNNSLMAAYDNDEYPFQHVAGLPQLSRVPLTRAFFAMQDGFDEKLDLPGVAIDSMDIGVGDSDFEIALYIESSEDKLTVVLERNPQQLTDVHAAELLDIYIDTLQRFADNPNTTLDELPSIHLGEELALQPNEPEGDSSNITDRATQDNGAAADTFPSPNNRAQVGPATLNEPGLEKLEHQLLQVWAEVLGVQNLSRTDNFFDLGGHSLTALKLCISLEREVTGYRMPLTMLAEAPTVAEMAQFIGKHQMDASWSLAVPLQTIGSKPPLFCIHAAGGNVLLYNELATYLSHYDQPVYGIQSQGLDGSKPILKTVEEMAQIYIDEILTVNPDGPYLLTGYCLGGTIAYEVAQCLQAMGHTVAYLGLLETYNWSSIQSDTILDSVKYQAQRAEFMVRNFMMLKGSQRQEFIDNKKERIAGRTKVWSGAIRSMVSRDTDSHSPDEVRSDDAVLAEVWNSNDAAADAYIPSRYSGKVTQYIPQKDFDEYSAPGVGWESLAEGGVDVHTLPVYPAGMVYEPFVRTLAEIMTVDIDRGLIDNQSPNELADI